MDIQQICIKELLEVAFILVKILAIIFAGAWAYYRWGVKDSSELMPQFCEVINPITSEPFKENDESSCIFCTTWFLNNKGKTPLEVSNIELKIYSLPDISSNPEDKLFLDLSIGERLSLENPIHKKLLSPENDELSVGGTISRSISFAYFPEERAEWFKSNQLVLFVTADVCQFKSSKTIKSEIFTSKYLCQNPKEDVKKS